MKLTRMQRAYVRGAQRRWNVKSGATRSGKTWLDYAWTVPYRVRQAGDGIIALMGHTQETVARNVITPMRRIWGPDCVGPVKADGRVRLFGREAVVLGARDRDRVRAIQGAAFAYCYGDEVTTWHRDVFEMVKSRLDGAGSRFDGTCNPAGPGHWFKAFLDSGADIFQQRYTIDDNPFLPAKFVADLKAEYAGSVRYDRYILGRWAKAEGRVFASFGPGCVADAPQGNVKRIAFGADIGHANATAFVAVAVMDGAARGPGDGALGTRLCALAEFYHSGIGGDTRSPLRYARDFIAFRDRTMAAWPGAVDAGVYVDPSARGFIAQLREIGCQKVYRARNAVLQGVGQIGGLLDGGRLTVLRRCVNLAREMEGYVWDDAAAARGEDRVVKVDDHAVDALRYVVASRRW